MYCASSRYNVRGWLNGPKTLLEPKTRMHAAKIVVLDGYALNPGDLSWDSLKQLGTTVIHDRTPETEVIARASHADILLTNKTPLPAGVIDQLPSLRFIGVMATGYDIIDISAARRHGIIVSNVPSYGTPSVAQFTFALILELCHHVGLHSDAVRRGEWSSSADWSFWKEPLIELAEKTMGVVGFGRIGSRTASMAAAFGMKVLVHDRIVPDNANATKVRSVSLDHLLAESDIVSLHCPLFADTQGLINSRRLETMKRTALLINTSRGALVVDHDLAAALNAGVIAGAGLDVLSIEPPASANPLLSARNCIVTPHIAWATREARSRLLGRAIENVRCFLESKPQHTV